MEENRGISLDNLPVEMISKICESLPVSDQCSLSQTCKICYDACDTKWIHGQQAIICNNLYSLQNITRLLSRTKRRYLHLRFCNVKFTEDLSSMWQRIGRKVITMKMFNCQLQSEQSSNAVEQIFRYCDEMEEFKFEETDCRRSKNSVTVLYQTLHSLNEHRFVHPKIRAIGISVGQRLPDFDYPNNHVTAFNYDRLFPNVSEFDFHFNGVQYSYSYLEHSGLLSLMQNARDNLVKMSLITSGMRWWTLWNSIAPTTIRLRELTFKSFHIDEAIIREFFTRLSGLEKLKLHIDEEVSSELILDIIAIVLLRNEKLTSLKIIWRPHEIPLIIRKDILKLLFVSKLHTLHLKGNIFCDSDTTDVEIQTNDSIRNVGIITHDYWLTELFLLKCKRIKYLEILALDDSLVRRIWETQTFLKSLIIKTHFYDENQESRPVNADVSENTKHLEYLQIKAKEVEELGYVFLNFHFVNLRCLEMKVQNKSCEPFDTKLESSFREWISKSSCLRSMKFTNLQLRDEFWRDMLYPEKLEHLVIFEDIDGWDNKKDDSIERKLLQCPQLRCIVRWNDVWFRDIFDGSVKRKPWSWHKPIHVIPDEKVGTVSPPSLNSNFYS